MAETTEAKRVRVILFPFPAQGHTLPALRLAERFVEGGAAVSLVVFEDRLCRVNAALHSAGMICDDSRLSLLVLSSGRASPESWNDTGHDKPDSVALMAWQCHEAQEEFEKLVTELKASSSSSSIWWIVSDTLLGWTQDVASKLGIPRYVFYPSPASILAGVFHVESLGSQGLLPLKSSEPDSLVHIPGMPPVRVQDMHSHLRDSVPQLELEFYVSNCVRVHEAAGVFINSCEALEPVALNALKTNPALNPNLVPVFPVGPLLPGSQLQIARARQLISREEKTLVWLNQQPPRSVVFVSFGSIAVLSDEQIEEVGRGLAASGHRFLWVLRRAEAGRSKEELIDEGSRGLVVENEWVPQLEILAHNSTGGFFTHGGWNSTLESLSHGVPMLVLPGSSDQFWNSKMVADELRVGLRLAALEREAIASSLSRVMDPISGFRDRAQALKISANPPDSVCIQSLNLN